MADLVELNRAIEASLQDSNGLNKLDEEKSNLFPRPPDPSNDPPVPGMTLCTTIKNGWVTKEWRMQKSNLNGLKN